MTVIGKGLVFGAAALGALTWAALTWAQTAENYRTPPAPIAQILDTPPTPAVSISGDRRVMALLGRERVFRPS